MEGEYHNMWAALFFVHFSLTNSTQNRNAMRRKLSGLQHNRNDLIKFLYPTKEEIAQGISSFLCGNISAEMVI